MNEYKEPLRDKNGLTEAEFLAAYRADRFERPSVTVDIVLFDCEQVLLIRRGGHPSLGKLAFPGGFVEPDETVEQAAERELLEETHVSGIAMRQLPVFSEPKRDPRTRIITVPFLAQQTGVSALQAGDDARDAAFWQIAAEDTGTRITFRLSHEGEQVCTTVMRQQPPAGVLGNVRYTVVGDSPLAGDHAAILAAAWDAWQACRPSRH